MLASWISMRVVIGWATLLAVLTIAYAPGLSGPFVYDDSSNIVDNGLLHIKDLSPSSLHRAALSGSASALKRPVTMLTLGINYVLSGEDPFFYKVTNLVIHLLNAGLVGLLVLNLTRASNALRIPTEQQHGFALIVTAIWALHPIQVTAVLYVVQRMTSLSALFTLLGLILYVCGRRRLEQGRRGLLLIGTALLPCLPLAVLSKDNGILMVAYAAVIELFVFRQAQDTIARRRATWIASAIVFACIAATATFLVFGGDALKANYEARGLTMSQRLLTEGRVLVWYLRLIVLPDLSQFGLVHDDWAISTSLLKPHSTAFAWALIATLGVVGWWMRDRISALGFGIAWFLVGHALESSIIPLNLVFEHRNYLPSLGVIVGAASVARHVGERLQLRSRATVPALIALPVLLAALTSSRAFEWSSILDWSVAQVQRHPRSPANHYLVGMLYTNMAGRQREDTNRRNELIDKADEMFSKALALDPAMGSAQIARVVLRAQLSRRIPDDIFESMLAILHTQRLPAPTQYTLIGMLDCAAGSKCKLTEDQVQKIAQATLDNPYCDGQLRAMIFESLAGYYGLIKEDDAAAVRYAREAVATPGAPYSSNFVLVKWLTNSAHYDEALAVIVDMEKSDPLNQYQQPRLEWSQAVEQRIRESKEQ